MEYFLESACLLNAGHVARLEQDLEDPTRGEYV